MGRVFGLQMEIKYVRAKETLLDDLSFLLEIAGKVAAAFLLFMITT